MGGGGDWEIEEIRGSQEDRDYEFYITRGLQKGIVQSEVRTTFPKTFNLVSLQFLIPSLSL